MTNAETYLRSAIERANRRTRDCVDTRADELGSHAYNLEKSVILLRRLLKQPEPRSHTIDTIRSMLSAGFTESEILRAGATIDDIRKAKEES